MEVKRDHQQHSDSKEPKHEDQSMEVKRDHQHDSDPDERKHEDQAIDDSIKPDVGNDDWKEPDVYLKDQREFVRRTKNFDMVDDYSDHYYRKSGSREPKLSTEWIEKLEGEETVLKKALDETNGLLCGEMYVRVYSSRIDLMRVAIVGPQGTPYHDGLFVFDVFFPPNYPNVPPMIYYHHSGEQGSNPFLKESGEVDLKYIVEEGIYSILSVLLKIQGVFFSGGQSNCSSIASPPVRLISTEEAFLHSLEGMIHIIHTPPKHFEALVAEHFQTHARDILSACEAYYMDGFEVGSLVHGKVPADTAIAMEGCGTKLSEFRGRVKGNMNKLIDAFTLCGVHDCEEFRVEP